MWIEQQEAITKAADKILLCYDDKEEIAKQIRVIDFVINHPNFNEEEIETI